MIVDNYKCSIYLQPISKMEIMFKDKARADEKAQSRHGAGWTVHFEEARNTAIGH